MGFSDIVFATGFIPLSHTSDQLTDKDPKWEDNLKAACKDGIVEYYDNVGGRTLELALDLMKLKGRVVLCGGISQCEFRTSLVASSMTRIDG